MWGARFGGLEDAAGYLVDEAPLLGLASRRAWGETGEVLGASELVFETRLSARGAGMALNEVAPEVPVCVHAFLADLATVDGHVGMGWRLGAAGKSHAVMSRRALFAETETTARIAEAVGTLMREGLRDFELGEAWAGFAASTIPKLRSGDEQQGMDIRVITSAGGAVEAVELDFFRIPTKLGVSLVQSFNLATDKLELLGNIEGDLGVTPSVGGVTWVDRARMSYDRRGLGVEFGYVRHG